MMEKFTNTRHTNRPNCPDNGAVSTSETSVNIHQITWATFQEIAIFVHSKISGFHRGYYVNDSFLGYAPCMNQDSSDGLSW
jgi:hypothetical protein